MDLKKLYYIAILSKFGDLATTYYVINGWGSKYEANFAIRYLINNVGLIPALFAVFLWHVFLVTLLCEFSSNPRNTKSGLILCIAVMIFITLWNLFQIFAVEKL